MAREFVAVAASLLLASSVSAQSANSNTRPRASTLGLKVGILPTGPLNAITDVAGVEVGHTTIIRGDDVHTGVTAICFARRCRARFSWVTPSPSWRVRPK